MFWVMREREVKERLEGGRGSLYSRRGLAVIRREVVVVEEEKRGGERR